MRRPMTFLAISLCVASGGDAVTLYAKPPIPDKAVSAPIRYDKLMLVLTSRDGAAAVIFTARTPNSARFQWRYESRDGKKKTTGEGKVTSATRVIKAGPIQLFWSSANSVDWAWIYYRPEEMRVNLSHSDYFQDRYIHVSLEDEPVFIKRLDLKRFMKPVGNGKSKAKKKKG